ncbi:chaperonin 10-like protein [Crassisporium funariophilum]|nr:chaperonin 10-like protein [Crassisporium funariophilum]
MVTSSQDIPPTILALTASHHSAPSKFSLNHVPSPILFSPDSVLVKVSSSGVNPGDVIMASGKLRAFVTTSFPHIPNGDFSGTIVQLGTGVKGFVVGDEVFGIRESVSGCAAEYLAVSSRTIGRCPRSSRHGLSSYSALPCVGLTALQAFEYADRTLTGGLRGKTVFVNAGLSGTGSIAVQLAKHVFGATKVITTVSTHKVDLVPQLVGEGTVDMVVDYQTQDVVRTIGKGSVDFFYDTMGEQLKYVEVMKKGNLGLICGISGFPSSAQLGKAFPEMPWAFRPVLDVMSWFSRWRVERCGTRYRFFLMHLDDASAELARLAGWVEEEKIKPIVGSTAKLQDLKAVIEGYEVVAKGKGGIGKFVIEME